MAARFIHTADWQLGKPFAGVTDVAKRSLLQQERVAVLRRIAEVAREFGAGFILVAGDVFDSSSASQATVASACSAIGKMPCPVYLIPGNHDSGGPGCLWRQPFFLKEQAALAPNLTVILESRPVDTGSAVIYPCPLLRRRETVDTTAWLRTLEPDTGKPRIVLAHGSVQGFGPEGDDDGDDGAVNLIDLSRLEDGRFDYIALGDWHGTKQVSSRAWYSGTPEPDRFPRGESNEPGNVLAVSVSRGALPDVIRTATGRICWHEAAFHFQEDSDLAALQALLPAITQNRASQDLLRLELTGSLSIEAAAALADMLESWRARLLRLKLFDYTRTAPSAAELASLVERAGDPMISRVARQLVERAGLDDAGAAVARTALRELYSRLTS